MAPTEVGTVSSIRRYPVKSMGGELLDAVPLELRGVEGDRTYALIDDESGNVVSVKRPKRWGRMFDLTAVSDGGGVSIVFPDGEGVAIDDASLPGRLSDFFGRAVSVASVPPEGATFEEVWHRELKDGADPYFGLPSRTEEGEELVDGGQFMGDLGGFFNGGPVHLVTTSTLAHLGAVAPESSFDAERFRPNFVIDTSEAGFVESLWPGRTLHIGGVDLAVQMNVPRCVVTTLPQHDLPADPDVLRTITRHNFLDPGFGTSYPCVGVYANVVAPGEVRTGQPVTID